MNNYPNPYISKKTKPQNCLRNQKMFPSQKRRSQVKFDQNSIDTNAKKNDFKALIEIIPSDQKLIEQYIAQLKDKLQQIRSSPKKKNSARMQTQQIFKRHNTRSKSKAKSNEGYSRAKSIAQSANFLSANKNNQLSGLHNFKQARDQFKRSKQRLFQKRSTTQKQNNRYAQGGIGKTQSRHIPTVAQSCDLRMRSNTQQVIRSQNNPARIYRYSSLKKTGFDDHLTSAINNNFVFDKIVNVHHNINIYTPSQTKTKERLRRELNEEEQPIKECAKFTQSTHKKKQENLIQKIEDLSTINAKKQTLNFLGESGIDLKEQLQKRQQKQVSKILDFLGWKTNEMKNVLTNFKQKKRKNGLDKLGKIFPKGFFA